MFWVPVNVTVHWPYNQCIYNCARTRRSLSLHRSAFHWFNQFHRTDIKNALMHTYNVHTASPKTVAEMKLSERIASQASRRLKFDCSAYIHSHCALNPNPNPNECIFYMAVIVNVTEHFYSCSISHSCFFPYFPPPFSLTLFQPTHTPATTFWLYLFHYIVHFIFAHTLPYFCMILCYTQNMRMYE